jgi:predicted dehydrogenase
VAAHLRGIGLIQPEALPLIVAGLGGISHDWLAAVAESPDWELAAVCDPDPDSRARFLGSWERPAPATFSDLEEALCSAPGTPVLLLTPPAGRFAAARLCLQRGHPLLTEKPMCLDLGRARTLAEIARCNQVPFAVNQNYRYCSIGQTVRQLVDQEAVGPIAFAECSAHRRLPAYGYRARERDVMVFEIGVHYVDLLRFWFACDVAAAQALAPRVPFNGHSSAAVFFALIEMTAGQSVSLTASRESRGQTDTYLGRWRFCGPDGSIHVNDFGQGPGVYIDRDRQSAPQLVAAGATTEEGFRLQLDEFAASLREGRPAETNCFDNLRSLAACFAIAEAYSGGRRTRPSDLLASATAAPV